ncbi:MAG: hypothetical protein GX558_04255, partial [Clostridiales bacterium]|nr:hypothetical protein [Clostridiales bacterium]
MAEWTPRRRMMAAYENRMPDRPGLAIYERYLPRGRAERMARDAGLGLIGYVPLTTQIGPAWHMLPGYPSPIDGAEFKSTFYRDARGALRERRGYLTPVGDVWQDVGPGVGAGSEHIAEYLVKHERDYDVLKWLAEHTRLVSNEPMLLRKLDEYGEDGVVFGRLDRTPYQKAMIELAGGERFLTDLYSDCDPLLSLLDAMAIRYREQVDRAMDSA